MSKAYRMTPARRRALRKAQLASAKHRYGTHRHEYTHFVKKGISKASNILTLTASKKLANFGELIQSGKRKR
jgi:hypothetical protein